MAQLAPQSQTTLDPSISAFVRGQFGTSGEELITALQSDLVNFNNKEKSNLKISLEGNKLFISSLDTNEITRFLADARTGRHNIGWNLSLEEAIEGRIPIKYEMVTEDSGNTFKMPFLRDPPSEKGLVTSSSYFGKITLPSGHRTSFISEIDPKKINPIDQNNKELAEQLRPLDSRVPYNAEQVLLNLNIKMTPESTLAVNLNSDLGLQKTVKDILRRSVITSIDEKGIEQPSFVIFSQGHSIAGLAALADWTRKDATGKDQYLFDTSLYMPQGKWTPDKNVRTDVATIGAQVWGDSIAAAKRDHIENGRTSAGGVAIALNGHRGDFTISEPTLGEANIDPVRAFGKPENFVALLRDRELKKVVIVTEHYVSDPTKVNELPLSILKNSDSNTFDNANKDLYDYMESLQKLGIEVIVVSGEQRVK